MTFNTMPNTSLPHVISTVNGYLSYMLYTKPYGKVTQDNSTVRKGDVEYSTILSDIKVRLLFNFSCKIS